MILQAITRDVRCNCENIQNRPTYGICQNKTYNEKVSMKSTKFFISDSDNFIFIDFRYVYHCNIIIQWRYRCSIRLLIVESHTEQIYFRNNFDSSLKLEMGKGVHIATLVILTIALLLAVVATFTPYWKVNDPSTTNMDTIVSVRNNSLETNFMQSYVLTNFLSQ